MSGLIRTGPPPFLAHLDLDPYGDPVAWTRARDADGRVLDKIDPQRRDTCWAERRCGICYLELDYRFGFLVQAIDEERARLLRWHLQPGVHPRCAPYAGMTAAPGFIVYLGITRSYQIRLWNDDVAALGHRKSTRKAYAAPYTEMRIMPVPVKRMPDGSVRSPSGLVLPG